MLGGEKEPILPLLWSKLSQKFQQKKGLMRFLPARVSEDGSEVTPVRWQGSGDVAAQARANSFLVTDSERESWAAGEMIRVLIK
jgi:molybdopterin molybdotransferase